MRLCLWFLANTQLSVKEVIALQAAHEGKKEVATKLVEHLIKQYLLGSQELAEKFKTQVVEITQQYEYFKIKTSEYTMSN